MLTSITNTRPRRSEFIKAARNYINVPYRHQGRNRSGVDCVGLIVCAARDVGYAIPDMVGYRRAGDGVAFMNHVRKNGVEIFGATPFKSGQVAAFEQNNFPAHLGIIEVDGPTILLIHSYAAHRKVEVQDFQSWRPLLVARFDLPGIREG